MADFTNENDELENNENSAPPKTIKPVSPFKQFLEKYPQAPILTLYALGGCLLLGIIVYFAVFYKPAMRHYAEEFCKCAATPPVKVEYAESYDGFKYLENMNPCFSEEFATYSEGMSIMDRKAYLLDFRTEVLKACPQKLENVFNQD